MKEFYNRRRFIRTTAIAGIGVGITGNIGGLPMHNEQSFIKGSRIGIIGLDTSHSVAFTKIFNDPAAGDDLAGFRVVVAYPKGSNDIESSVSRIAGFTREIEEMGIHIASSV